MSGKSLLDVNILIALFDPDHIHHDPAHDWFADHEADGWATCALTENGFVRVLANPSYGSPLNRPLELTNRLRQFCSSRHHRFWQDTASLLDEKVYNPALIRGHLQITDVYLLGLAKTMGGCLATFDGGIPLGSVVGATRATLAVISHDGLRSP